MASDETPIWGIHAAGSQADSMFRETGAIAVGWKTVGDLRSIPANREAYKGAVRSLFANKSNGYVINAASQLFRFANEMKQGDWVVYRSTFDRQIHVGRIDSDYRFDPKLSVEYPNIREVKWQKTLPLTAVSQGALHELGSALTLFQLKNYGEEFIEASSAKTLLPIDEDDETVASVSAEVKQTTEDFILRNLAKHLKGYDFQAFVGNLLETMGYRISESKRGQDEGVDITAHRDELKLAPPIIKVQVKSGGGPIGRPEVQALLGSLGTNEYGLFVTLGDYSRQALDFGKSKSIVQLINGQQLVSLIFDHYEKLDPKHKSHIPLRRIYVPDPPADAEAH
jgi:restriction system protein